VAIAIQGVIVCAIAITGTYVKLAIMANVAILLVYLACCVGVWRLRQLDAGVAKSVRSCRPGALCHGWRQA